MCRYGENNVCTRLPPEGVCDEDFEAHILRYHVTGLLNKGIDQMSLSSQRSLEGESKKFSLMSFTQNLSAVLTDPNRSRSENQTFFTRHWGDHFVPQTSVSPSKTLPKCSKKVFETYSNTTGEAYRRYRAVRKALRVFHEANDKERKDTDDLPTIFIDPRFSLSNSDTFSAIFIIPPRPDLDALHLTFSGKTVVPDTPTELQQEKKTGSFRDYDSLHSRLEMMHDIVDGRLANKLVAKSDDFWTVVRSYSGLQELLCSAMKNVKGVRTNLKQVDRLVCETSKKIVQVHEAGERKRHLLSKLHDIACLREAQSTVQMMLSQGDYPKAIECIETSLEVLSGELHGVTCFRHLGSQLRELFDMIGRMMHEDFASSIQKELGKKPEPGTFIQAEGELSAVLLGLMRMRKYAFIGVLREEITEGVKTVMRQVVKNEILNSGIDLTDFDPSLNQLGEPVRRMKHADFARTVKLAMKEQFEFCLRLQALQELLLELVDRAHPEGEIRTEEPSRTMEMPLPRRERQQWSDEDEEEEEGEQSISSIYASFGQPSATSKISASVLMSMEIQSETYLRMVLPHIAEYGHQCAQQRISRLLIARAKNVSATEATTPTQLSDVFTMVGEYQKLAEEKGWYSTQVIKSSALSKALNKLSVDYIEKFHTSRKLMVSNTLDTELWKASEVSPAIQAILTDAMESGELRNSKENRPNDGANSSNKTANDSTTDYVPPSGGVVFDEETFVVVGSSLTMVKVLADYCEAIAEMPTYAQDWNSRVIELFKVFNSRSCQLILGAGALQLVGLKTISVRNLALVIRSLQLIVKVLPLVRDEMDFVLPDDRKHLLRHFRQVEIDYANHIGEIVSKLASVIESYTMQLLSQWEAKAQAPSKEFQQMCQHLLKFHNGLHGILKDEEVKELFKKVHNNLKSDIKKQLVKLAITPHDPLKFGNVMQDYIFLTQNINQMDGCKGLDLEPKMEDISRI